MSIRTVSWWASTLTGHLQAHQQRPISPKHYDVVAKSRRFAYAFVGRDDNQFGDRDGRRIVAINQPELAQCGFECCREISNVFRAKCGRVLIFQDCPRSEERRVGKE